MGQTFHFTTFSTFQNVHMKFTELKKKRFGEISKLYKKLKIVEDKICWLRIKIMEVCFWRLNHTYQLGGSLSCLALVGKNFLSY